MSVFDPHNPYNDYPVEMENYVYTEKIPIPLYLTRQQLEESPSPVNREWMEGYLGVFERFSHDEIMEMRKGYFASIALIDLEVGRVLEALKKSIWDKTSIIFTSDRGDMLGDHDLFVKGAYFYELCVRVPLLIKFPGGK